MEAWLTVASALMWGAGDFRSFYAAGLTVRMGQASKLYDFVYQADLQRSIVAPSIRARLMPLPYIHPPFEALIFAPLSLLPIQVAYRVFLVFNVACLWLVYRILRPRMNSIAAVYGWLPLAMLAVFAPIAAVLINGQDSIVLLTLFSLASVALEREREMLAGVIMGLGMFRFQLILPIAILFLCWRAWRVVVGVAISGGLLTAISLMMVSSPSVYLDALRNVSNGTWSQPVLSMPNLRGLLIGLGAGDHPLLILALMAATIWFGFLIGSKLSRFDQLMLSIPVACFLSYHLLIHDLTLLLLPLCITLERGLHYHDRKLTMIAALLFVCPLLFSLPSHHMWLMAPILLIFAAMSTPRHSAQLGV